jgi:hypothetical protein
MAIELRMTSWFGVGKEFWFHAFKVMRMETCECFKLLPLSFPCLFQV